MSSASSPASGWYPDPGRPGWLRLWDGNAWTADARPTDLPGPAATVGGPAAWATPAATPAWAATATSTHNGNGSWSGSPGPARGGAPPWAAGFVGEPQWGAAAHAGPPAMDHASYGSRVAALLIDYLLVLGLPIAVLMLAAMMGGTGTTASTATNTSSRLMLHVNGPGLVIAELLFLGLWIWNFFVRQGRTGQSVGKACMKIALVSLSDGRPVGGGKAFLRYFVSGFLASVTFDLYLIVDYLWPLFDAHGQRLTDKMFGMAVVDRI